MIIFSFKFMCKNELYLTYHAYCDILSMQNEEQGHERKDWVV